MEGVSDEKVIDQKLENLNLEPEQKDQEEEKIKPEPIDCPKCEGSAKNRKGNLCRRCNGTGKLEGQFITKINQFIKAEASSYTKEIFENLYK